MTLQKSGAAFHSAVMRLSRSLLFPAPTDDTSIFTTCSSYVAPQGETLLQIYGEEVASDTLGTFYQRRSADNGRTWEKPVLLFAPQDTPQGVMRQGGSALLRDAKKNRLLRFFNQHCYPAGSHSKAVFGLTTIHFAISEDEGRSFSPSRQLVVEGFSAKRWAPGVTYGENSMMFSFFHPFVDGRGRIILPAQFLPVLPPDFTDIFRFPLQSGCFMGEWDSQGGLRWNVGQMLSLSTRQSIRGVFEPTISELKDGRFFMICRGSNSMAHELPARKWTSVSQDGGQTWSEAHALAFDDGELPFSPSSGSCLIRHSAGGKLYWIGNLLPKNAQGNGPRHPLVIAEVDESRLCLIRKSVFEIDTRTAADSERLELSNFKVYEDRMTGEFVLTMARLHERSSTLNGGPTYQYRIQPDCH